MGQNLATFYSQVFFLPDPTFTEKQLPDQTGKVHIITGGYTGIGFELACLLYPKGATLYLAGRSSHKGESAVRRLQKEFPSANGKVHFLQLDLADLSTIKASAEQFLQKEDRLDVLVNNAGVMFAPDDQKTKQGYDLQVGTNVYGHFLFTHCLTPRLLETTKKADRGTVRVAWASSLAADLMAPKAGLSIADNKVTGSGKMVTEGLPNKQMYGQSKAGDLMLAVEMARRYGKDGLISTSFNPGNLRSELGRHMSMVEKLVSPLVTHPVHKGAWTELYAGWSPEITFDNNGSHIIPWGRFGSYNATLQKAVKPVTEGGEGKPQQLWEACEEICKLYITEIL